MLLIHPYLIVAQGYGKHDVSNKNLKNNIELDLSVHLVKFDFEYSYKFKNTSKQKIYKQF
jgi:hypothetical protein